MKLKVWTFLTNILSETSAPSTGALKIPILFRGLMTTESQETIL